MENFESKIYRKSLADELKDLRSNGKSKAVEVLSEKSSTPEYAEAKIWHGYEREYRMLSDQAILFLQENNIFECGIDKLRELTPNNKQDGMAQGLTYKTRPNIHLNNTKIDWPAMGEAIGFHRNGNKNYWESRNEFKNMDQGEVNKIIDSGPYNHGRAVGKTFGVQVLNLVEGGEEKFYPLLGDILSYGYHRATHVSAHLMKRIDTGTFEFGEYEILFKQLYDSFIDFSAKLVTLLAREPQFSFSELQSLLKEKLGEEYIKSVEESFENGSDEKMTSIARKENIEDDEKKLLYDDLSQFVRVFKVLDEYMKENVQYKEEQL